MISRIIELSLRNRFLVLLLTAVLVGAGAWSISNIRLDAIPDLSDAQVIVTTEYPGQNPEVVDQQVTYPLASAMLAVPGSTVVRGLSMFEQSFVYVLFEDGTDIYWARSRVLEYLNFARDRLPEGVQPKLGPDATGVGWVYQYVLYPGYYSPTHPKGLWRDPEFGAAPAGSREWYAAPQDAPASARDRLVRVRAWERPGNDPISGAALVMAEQDLSQLRSLQDWYLRYPLTSVEDVSEVASIGGFVKQYQVALDPQKLQAFGLALPEVIAAIQRSNNDVGGSFLELAENEYMIRSRGYLKGLDDLAKVPLGVGARGTPVMLGDVATLQIGGEARRGVSDLDGEGEAVGGVVVARFGANAYKVIADVKAKLAALEDGLPAGVFVKATYDRSRVIERAVRTLRSTLVEELVVVGVVCLLFLLAVRSGLVAMLVVPCSVVIALLVMNLLGMNANIMSLGGIAISIGVVVDSAVIMVENAHKHLDLERERPGRPSDSPTEDRAHTRVMLAAATEVGPQLFFSLLIITVSFLPVFVLGGEAGRLFKPLAFTKTFAMTAAAVLSITLIPVLMYYFVAPRVWPARWGRARALLVTLGAALIPAGALWVIATGLPGLSPFRWWIAGAWALLACVLLSPQRLVHEDANPVSRILRWLYEPLFRTAMALPWLTLALAVLALASTWHPIARLGSEFMPPLDEGDLLDMPTTDPSIGITKSKELLQQRDRLIKTFPEVLSVHGKAGRADTATDPAPLSMLESVIRLEPDRAKWRTRRVTYAFSDWPSWLKRPFTSTFWPEQRPITTEELTFGWQEPDGTTHDGLNSVVSIPGVANAWPYPIENRLNMLATGIKTPVGIKVMGPDLLVLGDLAERAAATLRAIPGVASAYAERTLGGYYLDFDVDREAAARYGLTVGDVQDTIQSAIGGKNVTTTVEGAQRYPLNVRYLRDFRDDVPALRGVLVAAAASPDAAPRPQVPLGQLAQITISPGPAMIRSENAVRSAWVFVDVAGRDLGGFVGEARAAVAEQVQLPPGYTLAFAGQFEFWERALPRLIAAGVLTVAAIVLLLYVSSGSWLRVGIVMLAVPFSLIGALWFMHALGYNLSLAAVIGMIALAGLDAETGMVMLLYLDNSYERFGRAGRLGTPAGLYAAVHDGAVRRIRPKAMTVAAAMLGLLPVLWSEGAGADTMRRIAAPMIGGLGVSFVMELLVYPVLFYLAKGWQMRGGRGFDADAGTLTAASPGAVRGV